MTDTTIKALLKLLSQFQYVAPKKLGQTVNLVITIKINLDQDLFG